MSHYRCGCRLSCADFRSDERQLSLFPILPRCHAYLIICEPCCGGVVAIPPCLINCCLATELTRSV